MTNLDSKSVHKKIDLFIAGAQKAGTTSLKHYLGEHTSVYTHEQKEFAYFYDDNEYQLGYEAAAEKYFPTFRSDQKLIAKNAGLYVKESAIKRLKEHNPHCQIVLILRNPVERAYSAFHMEKNYGNLKGTFNDLKPLVESQPEEDWRYDFFIKMGMYVNYVRCLQKHFPSDQITLFRFEDLIYNPVKLTTELFSKLGVDSNFHPNFDIKYNVTRKMRSANYARLVKKLLENNNPIKKIARKLIPSPQNHRIGDMMRNVNKSKHIPDHINNDMQTALTKFYKPYNDQLTELTGLDFSIWNTLSNLE